MTATGEMIEFAALGSNEEISMKICCYNGSKFGLVRDELIFDVTKVLYGLPSLRYPFPPGDQMIEVNGEVRQESNTRHLVYDVQKLIEYASQRYTLQPGDTIMTGTPEGVGPIEPGDTLSCKIDGIGAMEVAVQAF